MELVTYGYFICIVLEKSAKDSKRTKAQVLKLVASVFYDGKMDFFKGFKGGGR